jgi:hypothetical protein
MADKARMNQRLKRDKQQTAVHWVKAASILKCDHGEKILAFILKMFHVPTLISP